ncbi:hypothetical protein ACN2C6_05755 [Caulobacter sp. ErkDOM-YI]|uniref:hypothetical protein n=1 Tax=unclassified Caulobacter TaxID=2648921 RepID=UPI003AF45829
MDFNLTPLKTFAVSQPVLYGAPLAAVLGVVLGLVFQVGPQTEAFVETQPFNRAAMADTTQPIGWPSGKVPDYVIGTDFLAQTRPRETDPPRHEVEPPPVVYAAPEPAPTAMVAARPARDETRWASTRGDILDIRLPEDEPPEPTLLN